jgi:hypothetical protein
MIASWGLGIEILLTPRLKGRSRKLPVAGSPVLIAERRAIPISGTGKN